MIQRNYQKIVESIPENVQLVAVSKTHPTEKIQEVYDLGQRHFGENKVQELVNKQPILPNDIQWHLIGHLQTNKVKYIAPYIHLIHSVDRVKLLAEINKQAKKNNRTIQCLLQVKIAQEESKYGMNEEGLLNLLASETYAQMKNISIVGLMGMASFTNNLKQIEKEFKTLNSIYLNLKKTHSNFKILSMGMSGDYQLAIQCGSNMVRVGSSIFGQRNYAPHNN